MAIIRMPTIVTVTTATIRQQVAVEQVVVVALHPHPPIVQHQRTQRPRLRPAQRVKLL